LIKKLHDSHKEIADRYYQNIKYHSEIENNDDIVWENDFYFNPSIRYGHLEYFKSINGKIEVLHCTFFPSYFKNIPIYGFDVIALNNIVTGIFCDFTNCIDERSILTTKLKEIKQKYIQNHRQLPEWANFFSENFISINTKELDQEDLIKTFSDLFMEYVMFVEHENLNGLYLNSDEVKKSISIQNNYSFNQRKNDKTYKALSTYIGANKARGFIDNILFPVY
jgi:phycocyanobilin:ferredoxin oxidoreductase